LCTLIESRTREKKEERERRKRRGRCEREDRPGGSPIRRESAFRPIRDGSLEKEEWRGMHGGRRKKRAA
jgi:hypothetical protein